MTGTGSPTATHRKAKKGDGSARLDKHSGTGRPGGAKKGGAGGSYTWGVPGQEFLDGDVSALDRSDPNYMDEDELAATVGKEFVDKVEGSAEPVVKVVED